MKEPKIRFKGFSGEWEETKFGNLCSVAMCKRIFKHQTSPQGDIPFYKIGTFGATPDAFISRTLFEEYKKKYNYPQKGDILISAAGTIGRVVEYTGEECYYQDSNIVWLMHSDQLSNAFLKQLYPIINWSSLEGATIKRLYNGNILDTSFRLPLIAEQKLIATFFTTLDAHLSASTSRLASLKQMKAASLQAMFPQEGETVPKVRFKEFKGEWDKQSASDLFLSIDERNRPELPVLSACQDIRGMIPREKIGFNVSHDTSNEVTYKRVKPGQFVIHLRSFQGGFAHSSYDGIISPAYTVFDFKDKERHDDYYWKIVFMSRAFIDRLRLITYGIRDGRSINFDEFKNLLFLFPSKEEQHAIATFFRSLDRQIALHTQRLEKLKQIKAACLDKMFV